MTPPPVFQRPLAFLAGAPTVAMPLKSRIGQPMPRLAKDTFQDCAQGVLEYLVGTLRKAW